MYYSYLLFALVCAFAVGMITGAAGRHGVRWIAAESLASGFAGLLFLLLAIALILLLPDLGRFVWRLAESPPGEDIVIGALLLVTITGAVMGVQPVLRRRRRTI